MPRTHEQLMQIALLRPGVKCEYESFKGEFALLKELVKARLKFNKHKEK